MQGLAIACWRRTGAVWCPEQGLVQRKSSAFASWPYIVYSKEKKRPHAATAEPGEIIIVKEEELAPGGSHMPSKTRETCSS